MTGPLDCVFDNSVDTELAERIAHAMDLGFDACRNRHEDEYADLHEDDEFDGFHGGRRAPHRTRRDEEPMRGQVFGEL